MRMNEQAFFVFPNHIDEWDHNKTKLIEAIRLTAIAKLDTVCKGLHSAGAAFDKAGGLCGYYTSADVPRLGLPQIFMSSLVCLIGRWALCRI